MIDELEKRRKQILDFVLMDDTFFSVAFEDTAACEEFIRIVTGIYDLKIIENKTQYFIRNIGEHSVVLDLLASDDSKRVYCVEIQKKNDDDHQRRVRFNQSNVDVSLLDKGTKYGDLPVVISIFVSKKDIFNDGKCCYHVDRVTRETKKAIDNGRREIYINAENDDGSAVAQLMKEFYKPEPSDKFPNIFKRVKYLKHSQEGVGIMCDKMQKIVDEEVKEAVKEAVKKEKEEAIINMIKNNETNEKIMMYQNVSVETIEEIRKKLNV